jgi:hypothetical protein
VSKPCVRCGEHEDDHPVVSIVESTLILCGRVRTSGAVVAAGTDTDPVMKVILCGGPAHGRMVELEPGMWSVVTAVQREVFPRGISHLR